jgi:hypothetical protein
MTRVDTAIIRQEIEALNARFAWLVDHRDGMGVEELFTADAVYGWTDRFASGREQIRSFFELRRARGRRTSRHVYTNLHLTVESAERAFGTTLLTLYACDGDPPHPASPVLVADYEDIYVRDENEQWLYAKRIVTPVFGQRTRHSARG